MNRNKFSSKLKLKIKDDLNDLSISKLPVINTSINNYENSSNKTFINCIPKSTRIMNISNPFNTTFLLKKETTKPSDISSSLLSKEQKKEFIESKENNSLYIAKMKDKLTKQELEVDSLLNSFNLELNEKENKDNKEDHFNATINSALPLINDKFSKTKNYFKYQEENYKIEKNILINNNRKLENINKSLLIEKTEANNKNIMLLGKINKLENIINQSNIRYEELEKEKNEIYQKVQQLEKENYSYVQKANQYEDQLNQKSQNNKELLELIEKLKSEKNQISEQVNIIETELLDKLNIFAIQIETLLSKENIQPILNPEINLKPNERQTESELLRIIIELRQLINIAETNNIFQGLKENKDNNNNTQLNDIIGNNNLRLLQEIWRVIKEARNNINNNINKYNLTKLKRALKGTYKRKETISITIPKIEEIKNYVEYILSELEMLFFKNEKRIYLLVQKIEVLQKKKENRRIQKRKIFHFNSINYHNNYIIRSKGQKERIRKHIRQRRKRRQKRLRRLKRLKSEKKQRILRIQRKLRRLRKQRIQIRPRKQRGKRHFYKNHNNLSSIELGNNFNDLEEITINQSVISNKINKDCMICMKIFKIGEKAKYFPCSHLFHTNCIIELLERKNECPLCKH